MLTWDGIVPIIENGTTHNGHMQPIVIVCKDWYAIKEIFNSMLEKIQKLDCKCDDMMLLHTIHSVGQTEIYIQWKDTCVRIVFETIGTLFKRRGLKAEHLFLPNNISSVDSDMALARLVSKTYSPTVGWSYYN